MISFTEILLWVTLPTALLVGLFLLLWTWRGKLNARNSARFGPSKTDAIVMAWAVVIGLTIYSLSDKAISLDSVIPYGIVWTWMNPYYWGANVYKWVILGIQFPVMLFQYYLAKKGKLNWKMLHLLLFSTIYFRLMGVFQEVTPVIFSPFATINPLFTLVGVIQKIPFWSFPPSLTDPHYLCSSLGQCVGYTVDREIFFHGALNPDIATHIIILFWLVAPAYAWWKKRRPKMCSCMCGTVCNLPPWDEDRFWVGMTLPLSVIMMFGFVVIMFFGCCAGYHWFA